MELRLQRRADNERVVRRLEAHRWEGEAAIVCECTDPSCVEHLDVTRAEWQRVHGHGAWFFVRPGHEEPSSERVVEADERFLVVEPLG